MSSLVSIIIPTRNRKDFLKEAVASIAAQTYHEIECIIVDDGSDEPIEIAAREAWGPRPQALLKIIRQDAANGNVARNRGLDECSGEFIQFMDSDDLLDKKKLTLQISQLQKEPAFDVAISHEVFFFESPEEPHAFWNVDWWNTEYDYLDRFCWEEAVWQTAGPLWRRDFLERNGLRWNDELPLLQDWEFHAQVLMKKVNICRNPEVLVYLRDHSGARVWSSVTDHEQLLKALFAIRSIAQDLRASELLTGSRALSLEGRVWFHLNRSLKLTRKQKKEGRRQAFEVFRTLALTPKRKIFLNFLGLMLFSDKAWSIVERIYRRFIFHYHPPHSTWKKIEPPRWMPVTFASKD